MDLVSVDKNSICPICSNKDTKNIYQKTILIESGINFNFKLYICNDCDFVFQSSAYSKEYEQLINKYYKKQGKSEHSSVFPTKTKETIFVQELLPKFSTDSVKNILEIGSARGDLLFFVQEKFKNAKILGVEPSDIPAKVPTMSCFFDKELFDQKFDIIILQQVFEHFVNPVVFIKDLVSFIYEQGIIFIEVPSLENQLAFFSDDFSFEHVSYFTKKSMFKLAAEAKSYIKYIDESNFLNCVISKEPENIIYQKSLLSLFSTITKYIGHKAELSILLELECKEKKVIFYGMGYYFRYLVAEIEELLKGASSLSFFDDNFDAKCDNYLGLERSNFIPENSFVIISSGNYLIKQKILKKLINMKVNNIHVFLPWKDIIEVNKLNNKGC